MKTKPPKPTMPKCPRCKTARHVVKLGLYLCQNCNGTFDETDPDEGGDFDDRNPAARMEREERNRRR